MDETTLMRQAGLPVPAQLNNREKAHLATALRDYYRDRRLFVIRQTRRKRDAWQPSEAAMYLADISRMISTVETVMQLPPLSVTDGE